MCIFFDINEYYYSISKECLSILHAANFNSIVDKYCTHRTGGEGVNVTIFSEKEQESSVIHDEKWKIARNFLMKFSLRLIFHSVPVSCTLEISNW